MELFADRARHAEGRARWPVPVRDASDAASIRDRTAGRGWRRCPGRRSPRWVRASQYGDSSHPAGRMRAIGEPLTCKNSVELRGFEPLTPSMRTRCATGLRYSPENLRQRSKTGPCPRHGSPGDSGAAGRHHGHQVPKPSRRCAMTTPARDRLPGRRVVRPALPGIPRGSLRGHGQHGQRAADLLRAFDRLLRAATATPTSIRSSGTTPRTPPPLPRRPSLRWCPRPSRSCWRAGTSRSRRWSAWTSPATRDCASPPPARSA